MSHQPRGFVKLRKGIIRNLHPDLSLLDESDIPFNGWFNLDLKFFYIEYGYHFEKAILTHLVQSITQSFIDYKKIN